VRETKKKGREYRHSKPRRVFKVLQSFVKQRRDLKMEENVRGSKKVSWKDDGMYYCNPLGWPLGRDRGLGAEEGPSADVGVGAERTGHWLVEHQLLLPEHLQRPEEVRGGLRGGVARVL